MMYFDTSYLDGPYPPEQNIIIINNSSECLVCLEMNNNNMIRLGEITNYKKDCECNAWIHVYCLNTWLNNKCVCPICRGPLIKYDNLFEHDDNRHTRIQHNTIVLYVGYCIIVIMNITIAVVYLVLLLLILTVVVRVI